jgi:hypothetical protein
MPRNSNSERYYKYKLVVLDDFKKVIDRKFFTHLDEASNFLNICPSSLRYQLKSTNHKKDFWKNRRFTKVHIDRQTISLFDYVFDENMEEQYDSDDEE